MFNWIKYLADDNFVSAGQSTGTYMQHSQTARERTLKFTFSNYGLQLNSLAVKPTDYGI